MEEIPRFKGGLWFGAGGFVLVHVGAWCHALRSLDQNAFISRWQKWEFELSYSILPACNMGRREEDEQAAMHLEPVRKGVANEVAV